MKLCSDDVLCELQVKKYHSQINIFTQMQDNSNLGFPPPK